LIWEFYNGITKQTTLLEFLTYFVLGAFTWASFEYFAHRYLFHMKATNHALIIVHFFMHGIHHLDPLDKNRLVFPPATSFIALYLPFRYIIMLFITSINVHILMGSFSLNYVIYDLTHYYLHHGTYMFGPLKYLRKCHMHHHFVPEGHNLNFGISILAKIFDLIFGTYYCPKN